MKELKKIASVFVLKVEIPWKDVERMCDPNIPLGSQKDNGNEEVRKKV